MICVTLFIILNFVHGSDLNDVGFVVVHRSCTAGCSAVRRMATMLTDPDGLSLCLAFFMLLPRCREYMLSTVVCNSTLCFLQVGNRHIG